MLSIMLAWDITRWRRTRCPLLCSMPGHAQYTLGPVTCIDNVVDNARVEGRHILKINDGDAEQKTKSRNRTSNFELTAETCASAPI